MLAPVLWSRLWAATRAEAGSRSHWFSFCRRRLWLVRLIGKTHGSTLFGLVNLSGGIGRSCLNRQTVIINYRIVFKFCRIRQDIQKTKEWLDGFDALATNVINNCIWRKSTMISFWIKLIAEEKTRQFYFELNWLTLLYESWLFFFAVLRPEDIIVLLES